MSLYTIAKKTYNATIRDKLPRKSGKLAGVECPHARLLDLTADRPQYKAGFISAIHDYVREGDNALLIAFGRGVSTVHLVRAGARVTAYEGAKQMIDIGERTIENAGVDDRVTVHHAVVGEAVDLYGPMEGAEVVSPADLPEGDVLALDCEGAELSILDGLEARPETVIVETHPDKGAPDEAVREHLSDQGYTVIDDRDYEPENDDKRVLVATIE